MERRERLATAFNLGQPDRPAILGGWICAPETIMALTGATDEEYYADPWAWTLRAERTLGSDGVIDIFEPSDRGAYRGVDHGRLEARAAYTVDAVLAEIDALPEPEEANAAFDLQEAYQAFVAKFQARQALCGDMVWCPADWLIVPRALWYARYGYETSFIALALHPERYRRLIMHSAVLARQRASVRARAIREGITPGAILTGEDLCSQRGPMVSPDFLRREYFPLVEWAVEPLLEVGAKLVWHCDGNYRPILGDVLACGMAGLQGFQSECGMDLSWIVNLRTRGGDPLLIFGPMPVTTVLRYGSLEEIGAVVRRAMDLCRDNAALVFFTSSSINPDVPLENIRAYWQAVVDLRW